MKLTLLIVAFAMGRARASDVVSQLEESNRVSRGVQTFGNSDDSENEAVPRAKSPPLQYTVVDWRKYYPFGGKLDGAPSNGTRGTEEQSPSGGRSEVVFPVYVKVPVRVPVKMSSRHFKKSIPPRMMAAMSVRVPKSAFRPKRYYKVTRVAYPMRRKFLYYKPSSVIKRKPKYIQSNYHKTSIHDLNKKDAYYSIRGRGYEVTEMPSEEEYPRGWYPANAIA